MDESKKECCGTCKYGSYDKTDGYVCANDEKGLRCIGNEHGRSN